MLSFDSSVEAIYAAMETQADDLDFGVVGLDGQLQCVLYNRHESELAGLSAQRVLGRRFFKQVAPCMNNGRVARQFVNAMEAGVPMDFQLDYVLTLRMCPVRVRLRLLHVPGTPRHYLLVRRMQVS